MKVALTGSSSTGKTTLARKLMEDHRFVGIVHEFVTEDARSLLRSLGHTSMDNMSREDLRQFQKLYLNQKSTNEEHRESFLVDRSFVDVAAYWLVRDSFDLPLREQASLESECKALANAYDLHVHFPFGQIPFKRDGYRSEDLTFHQKIADKIHSLLVNWGVRYVTICSSNLEERIQQVLSEVKKLSQKGTIKLP